uniref:RING-CH-type domain-containing protein n=1 Tax=Setaria italica TaxID=4555 RepID=K3XLL8_SETIT
MMEQEEACSSSSSLTLRQCRICHDEEDGRRSSMESPCACSGSLKYAHRGCVQRWCDEKGSTLCEICLQNFEPGYTVPPKKPADVAVTIRESLEVPRLNYEPEEQEVEDAAVVGAGDPEYAECARAAGRSASWCRSVAVTFTVVLLLRHLVTVATVGAANQFAFSLLTVYLLRASGILLPFYVVMRLISVIQHGQRQYRLQLLQRRQALRLVRRQGQGQGQQQQQHVVLVR